MKELFFDLSAILLTLVLLLTWTVPVHSSLEKQPPTPKEPVNSAPQEPADQEETPTDSPVTAALPVITVWYEQALRFGHIGNPQEVINILGNVRDPDGSVSSLTYRLNGRSAVTLDLGPNSTRLANRGDFNAAIDLSLLNNGSNTVVFTATDNQGDVQNKTITFNYTPGRTWPLPYATNWGSVSNIYDQAQVVDGLWQVSSSGVRPLEVGYDRLIAIGNVSWRDFEILVPVTVRGFYPDPDNPNDSGGVGVIARWQGHIGSGQPATGWTRLGAYGYYSNRRNALALRLDSSSPITQNFPFQLNQTYLMKLKVETVSQGSRYSYKVWQQGQPEPSWNSLQFSNIVNVVDTSDALDSGSVLLVAHRVDATFGNVTICPPDVTYPLSLNTNGSGTIAAQPGKSNYQCGEGVTLTAQPAPGWIFSSWSGDAAGSDSTVSLNVTRAMNVTANFVRGEPIELDHQTYLPQISR